MARSTINELSALVATLEQEREQHRAAIAEIEDVFARLGVSAPATPRRGRRPGRPAGKVGRPAGKVGRPAGKVGRPAGKVRRKRGVFATTANEMVLATIRKAGPKGASGAEISKAWQAAGRPGDAYNTLTLLTKQKTIQRHQVDGERGSRYTVR